MLKVMRFLLAFSVLAIFTSCETFINDVLDDHPRSNGNSGVEIPLSELPQIVLDYLDANYPNQPIIRVERDFDHYEVYLPGGIELYFDLNGNFMRQDDSSDDDNSRGEHIPVSDLPQSVIDYIAANFPNQTIVKAERDDDDYEVTLSNGVKLYFDLNGNFKRQDDDDSSSDDDDDDRGHDDDDAYLPISALPQSIIDYITDQYGDVGILKIELDDDEYEVYLDNGFKLEFDLNGNFKKAEREDEDDDHIAINKLPQAIADYLAANYPDNPVVKAELDDDDDKYEIYLQGGIKVYFDLNGNFLRAEG